MNEATARAIKGGVRIQAETEIREEDFRIEVDALKEKLRARQWWHVLFPYKFIIVRRDT